MPHNAYDIVSVMNDNGCQTNMNHNLNIYTAMFNHMSDGSKSLT